MRTVHLEPNVAKRGSRVVDSGVGAVSSQQNALLTFPRTIKYAKENNYPSATRIYGSYEAVLDDPEVDTINIPLPTSLHLQQAVLSAQKKKHIMLEKLVVLACESNVVQLMDDTMWMEHRRTANMRQFLDNLAQVGQLKSVQKEYHLPMGDFPDFDHFREVLSSYSIDKFQKLKPRMFQAVDDMLGYDIPELLKNFKNPYE